MTLRRNWLIVGLRHRFTQHDLIMRRRPIRTSIMAARKAWRTRKRQSEARGNVKHYPQREEQKPNVIPVSDSDVIWRFQPVILLLAATYQRALKEDKDGSAS